MVVKRAPQQKPVVTATPAQNTKAKDVVRLDAAKQRRIARNLRANRQIADQRARVQDNGWAVVRVFPVPQYQQAYDGPRSDFRETIYWNPTVETDARGNAEVSFVASDAVTSFRATAEGFAATGAAGEGQVSLQSKLPLTIDAHLPVEVTAGDTVRLPVTLGNETEEAIDATLSTKFGTAFKIAGESPTSTLRLKPKSKQTVVFALDVVASGSADVELKVASRGLTDELHKTIRVVPRGFPIELSASGTARKGQPSRHVLDLAGAMPGTIRASVMMYPSPVATIDRAAWTA